MADKVFDLRYQGKEIPVGPRRALIRKKRIWGITYIDDLRPHDEKPQELDLDETQDADAKSELSVI